jgi:apolipoprotein N-acyltransferase
MKIMKILPPLATSILLGLSFPSISAWPLAFIALIPLLLWVEGKSCGRAFLGGTIAGLLFHAIVFAWFASLTYWVGGIVLLGVGVLFLFLSLFWGAVMAGDNFVVRWAPGARIIALPAMWVLMEYVHNHVFGGFGWGSIGYSQWNNEGVAQLASVGSVYAVSFYIVIINVLAAGIIRRLRHPLVALTLTIALVALGIAIPAWGKYQMRTPDTSSTLRVGLVQPNFSLDVKWSAEFSEHIFRVLERQTDIAAENGAELVVWPESAFNGYLADETERIAAIIGPHDVFLLTGSNHYENGDSGGGEEFKYYNSAFLVDSSGSILSRYDKHHLAPFGEFVPFGKTFPIMERIVPAVADFTPGEHEIAPFRINDKSFGVVICFENSFPHLVRETAAIGVGFIVQLTNDGWFGRSAQPRQDLAIAVFRAIENGVTLVRGTNTGISCFIDPWGRISGIVSSPWGETIFARGVSVQTISTVAHDTVYKTYGDVWVLGCAVLLAISLCPVLYLRRKAIASESGESETDAGVEEGDAQPDPESDKPDEKKE